MATPGTRHHFASSSKSLLARLLGLLLCVHVSASLGRAERRVPAPATPKQYLIHLPGIGGHLLPDDWMLSGLKDGGVRAEVEIYDWTNGAPGSAALNAYDQNRRQAQLVAKKILTIRQADP